MEEKKKEHRKLAGSFVLGAACLLLAWFLVNRLTSYRPEHVEQTAYHQGMLYGVDVTEQAYLVFRVDTETGENSRIRVPRFEGGKACNLSDLTVTQAGEAYVVMTGGKDEASAGAIWRCDFGKGRLTRCFSLDQGEGERFWAFTGYKETAQALYRTQENTIRRYELTETALSFLEEFPLCEESAILADLGRDGTVFFTSPEGHVYMADSEGTYRCVFDNGRTPSGGWYTEIQFWGTYLHCVDSLTGQTYEKDLTDASGGLMPCVWPDWRAVSFDSGRMSSCNYEGREAKVGVLTAEDGRQMAAVCGEREYVAECLSWSPAKRILMILALWLCLLALAFLLRMVRQMLVRRQRVFPLALQATVLAAALLLPGLWLLRGHVLSSVRENALHNDVSAGIQLGGAWMERLDNEELQRLCSLEKLTEETRISYRKGNFAYEKLSYTDGEKAGVLPAADVEYRLYTVKEGEIYPLESRQYVLNIPLRYNYVNVNPLALEAMERAISENEIVISEYTDLGGQICSAFLPYSAPEGGYPILLEVAIPIQESSQTFAAQAAGVSRILYLTAALLLGTLLFAIWLVMRPVGQLKQAALAVTEGKLGTQAKVRGRSEAAVTARRFNHMSAQIAGQVAALSGLKEKYEAFVPLLLWELVLGKKSAGEREKPAMLATMTVGNETGDGNLRKVTEEIRRRGGEILSFEREAVTCLFLGEVGNALLAAVTILQSQTGKSRRGIAMGFERIVLGAVGDASRSAISAYSMTGELNAFLRRLAEELHTPLLVTGSAAEQIGGFFDRYHVRRLGSCQIRRLGTAEQIYEVLDGETGQLRRKKELTARQFEEGLAAFEAADYARARSLFVGVFSENREDLAALRYIRFCDENLEKTEAGQRYFAVY